MTPERLAVARYEAVERAAAQLDVVAERVQQLADLLKRPDAVEALHRVLQRRYLMALPVHLDQVIDDLLRDFAPGERPIKRAASKVVRMADLPVRVVKGRGS